MSGGEGEGETLEFTPTWVVAAVCTVISPFLSLPDVSFILEENFSRRITRSRSMKPFRKPKKSNPFNGLSDISDLGNGRLLAEATVEESEEVSTAHKCACKNKVPLLSVEALHHLHIFIFVLAIVHVTFCVLTIVFGRAKHWEDEIAKSTVSQPKLTNVQQHEFIKDRFLGFGKDSSLLGWMHSFFKQFYGFVTKLDYQTLRLGFIMTHCRGNSKFNFHKYVISALEDDFKQVVVGIFGFLWLSSCCLTLMGAHFPAMCLSLSVVQILQ
ncbi:hypothetical protein L6164_002865 [Bauhinia variegata]|uniref:Uncharacterized protein n=1 Tax=Bauhinia variegata TaxID=167791 RepID=A0ACB9PZH9_BAUVA|nr:hypothetical protein L6164_002865 [Bauhinia variegata]